MICSRRDTVANTHSMIQLTKLPPEILKHILGFVNEFEPEFRKINHSLHLPRAFFCIDIRNAQVSVVSKLFHDLVGGIRCTPLTNKLVIKQQFFFAISDCVCFTASNPVFLENNEQLLVLDKKTKRGVVRLCNVRITYIKSSTGVQIKLDYSRAPLDSGISVVNIIGMAATTVLGTYFGIGQDRSSTIVLNPVYVMEPWNRTRDDGQFILDNKQKLEDEVYARLSQITGSDFD